MKIIQQQLADRVYELLPHKKELEFGCEVEVGFGEYKERVSVITICADGSGFYTNGNYKEKLSILARIPIKIIGQPIRLADLFSALLYTQFFTNDFIGKIVSKYNLSKDNILDQSDEFCEFVYNLIK